MMFLIHNELGQPVKHKGQISKGDLVHFEDGTDNYYIVVALKVCTGEIKHILSKYAYSIQFKEGVGWGYGT